MKLNTFTVNKCFTSIYTDNNDYFDQDFGGLFSLVVNKKILNKANF